MLCCRQLCEFCAIRSDPEASLDDHSEAVDWEERRVFHSAISPYRGMPFVHSKDIRIRKQSGGLVFSPLGVADADAVLSSADETREVDVLFTVSRKKMRLKCLACAVGQCAVCREARADTERQSSLAHQEPAPSPKSTQPRRPRSVGKKPVPSLRRRSPGEDVEMEDEPLFVDDDGEVSRGYAPRGSPSGSSIEVAPNRSKRKRKPVDG